MPKKIIKKKQESVKEVWVEINESTKIRVGVSEFKGQHRVDIREHVETAKYEGFTKKGLNVLTNNIEELHKAIGVILETVKKEGLINDLEEGTEDEE